MRVRVARRCRRTPAMRGLSIPAGVTPSRRLRQEPSMPGVSSSAYGGSRSELLRRKARGHARASRTSGRGGTRFHRQRKRRSGWILPVRRWSVKLKGGESGSAQRANQCTIANRERPWRGMNTTSCRNVTVGACAVATDEHDPRCWWRCWTVLEPLRRRWQASLRWFVAVGRVSAVNTGTRGRADGSGAQRAVDAVGGRGRITVPPNTCICVNFQWILGGEVANASSHLRPARCCEPNDQRRRWLLDSSLAEDECRSEPS